MATKGETKGVVNKEEFRERIKGVLSGKGLEVSDLQVNLRLEDVDDFLKFIGKDWYTFGICMGVKPTVMDHVKEIGKNKPGRKRALLETLIKMNNARYEDIVYGLYNSQDQQDLSINEVLEHLLTRRRYENLSRISEPRPQRPPQKRQKKHSQSTEVDAWQAKYEERCKREPLASKLRPLSDLSPKSYCDHFYSMLWYEEREHIRKLKEKCDGKYYLFIYDHPQNVPLGLNPDRNSHYGFIEGPNFTDDKIEYATQASDSLILVGKDGSPLCKAFKHQYNFSHLKSLMYLRFKRNNFPFSEIAKCPKVERSHYEVKVEFEVKHSYFNHLHDAVIKVPDYIRESLLPNETSFKPLFGAFNPVYLDSFDFVKLDTDQQFKALQMITSNAFQIAPVIPPPPVILYGPFGSGKTRILARAAYEVMMNGMHNGKRTRILICAHHPQSIDIFIYAYFGRLEKAMKSPLPFRVIEISRFDKDAGATYGHMYMTLNTLSQQQSRICKMDHLIIIATYTMSLNLRNIFNEGFFTHLFLDEAAQVREPEAITPLAMATRDAKIVLAGDDKQVGPNILVLGEEARKYELHISLLERMMERYTDLAMGPVAKSYITKLIVNYRSHKSLVALPNFFYENLLLSDDKRPWEHKGPHGYSFVCSDSKLVPSYISPDHPFVEACIVLEEVKAYMKKLKDGDIKFHPRNICIISSTRKQLNQIREMADNYKEYVELRNVSFQPSFTIQGHEFDAVFLGLFEPAENDEKGAFFIKSLFNPYVFNTVLTRARTRVVAVGKPKEVIEFENASYDSQSYKIKLKCWHEYLKLCIQQKTLHHCDFIPELEELMKPKLTTTVPAPTVSPSKPIAPVIVTNKAASFHTSQQPSPVSTTVHSDVPAWLPHTVPNNEQQFENPGLPFTVPETSTTPLSFHHLPLHFEEQSFSYPQMAINNEKEMPWPQLTDSVSSREHHYDVQANPTVAPNWLQYTTDDQLDVSQFRPVHYRALSEDIIKGDPINVPGNSYPLHEMIVKVFDKVVQLEKDFHFSMQDLKNEVAQKKDDVLLQRCNDLTKENEELKKHLKQVAPKSIVDQSSSTIVARLEVAFRSNADQHVNWEEYGMKISIPKSVFPLSTTKERIISIEALAGGKFMFPSGMELVSAVYSINVNETLDEPITLKIEHCVHLTDKAELKYLKFAVASHETGPPYQFKFVEGGKFNVGNRYGVIKRKTFSLICIGLEGESGDSSSSSDEEEEDRGHMGQQTNHYQPEEEEGGEEGSDEDEKDSGKEKENGEGEGDGSSLNDLSQSNEDGSKEMLPIDSEAKVLPNKKSVQLSPAPPKPVINRKDMYRKISYNGQVFYRNHEEKVIFAAVKQLTVLFKYLESNQQDVEGQPINFFFANRDAYIELIFDNGNQKQPITGWSIQPQLVPCKLTKSEIDEYGSYERPAKCFVSVCPDKSNDSTVSTLHYCIPLKGITPSREIFIIRSLEKLEKVPLTDSQPITTPTTQSMPTPKLTQDQAIEIYRKHMSIILELLNGELLTTVATRLYSAKVISGKTFDNVTDPDSSRTKGISLAKSIKNSIKNDPESLRTLIAEFEKIEEFQKTAKDMKEKL